MNTTDYCKYCNTILVKNLIFILLLIGVIYKNMVILVISGIGLIINMKLTRKYDELDENEKEFHQLFGPMYIGLMVLLSFGVFSYMGLRVFRGNGHMVTTCHILYCVSLLLNVVGTFFVNLLEKLMYKLKMK